MTAPARPQRSDATDVVLVEERAVNERYRKRLKEEQERRVRDAMRQDTSRNVLWTDPEGRLIHLDIYEGPLVGRVALDGEDEHLGDGFYVGPRNVTWDGRFVMSWAAPASSLFYRGAEAEDPLADQVLTRRTFLVERDDIVAYDDELDAVDVDADPFGRRREERRLSVPTPPAPRTVIAPASPAPAVVTPSESESRPPVPREVGEPSAPGPNRVDDAPLVDRQRRAQPPGQHTGRPALRAESTLRAVLERPRTGQLASVLATLQPEQYHLVTWPEDQHLLVQGQPGTGKTVIAAHRAAYLNHPDRENAAVGQVGFFGPTDHFAEHVKQVIRDVSAGDTSIVVHDLPTLFAQLAGVGRTAAADARPEERVDTLWALGRLLDRAAAELRRAGRLRERRAVRDLVDAVFRRDPLVASLVDAEPEIAQWLSEARSFDRCQQRQQYLPFLASAGLAASPLPPSAMYDHLIVDEAQDVRPLEWKVLLRLLRRGGRLSLFGDTHQRRSDFSYADWAQLASELEVNDENGALPLVELDIAFRTTAEILGFANQLLPKGERRPGAIRSGPSPRVERVQSEQLLSATLREAERLADWRAPGLTAVIAMQPGPISDRFRKNGWSRSDRR